MKILFNNILENYSSINATNESQNYPVAQLVHPFLRLRFQSTYTQSIIQFNFTEDQEFSDFFWAYQNTTSMTLVLKDGLGVTLYTQEITTEEDKQADSVSFDKVSGVRTIEITANGSEGFFIGGLGAGVCFIMPDFISQYTLDNYDNSEDDEGAGFQTLQTYIEPARGYSLSFGALQETAIKSVDTEYKAVGKGKPLYIDIFEDNHSKEQPIYGKILTALQYTQSRTSLSFPMQIKECR